jgi:hypothetical protein
MSVNELRNAWGAIPLYWYSELDGRSQRSVETAIAENQAAMAWYAKRGIPVEVNEAHHWSLRGAPDETAVAAAYLAALNAKAQGVTDFILQTMWNTPPQIQPCHDLAKMLAKLSLVESLADGNFRVWRQVRAGLASLSPKANIAKGQLAASTVLALQVWPHIVHVVGFCEGDHAATVADVIESCEIVRGVIKSTMPGMMDMTKNRDVVVRRDELLSKAKRIIARIAALDRRPGTLSDPAVLGEAVRKGMLRAPQMLWAG